MDNAHCGQCYCTSEDGDSVSFVLREFAQAMEVLFGCRTCPVAVISDKGTSFPGPLRDLWPTTTHLLCQWHFSNSMLKELRPRVHREWWPIVREFVYWLMRDAHFATSGEFDTVLLKFFAIVRPRKDTPNARTALSNWVCNSIHLVRRKLFHRAVPAWRVMTATMVASSIAESTNSSLNSLLRIATLASRSLLDTARQLFAVASTALDRAGEEIYMARNSFLIHPLKDMVEFAATRLFSRQTARRIRKPLEAARRAIRTYNVSIAIETDTALTFSVQRTWALPDETNNLHDANELGDDDFDPNDAHEADIGPDDDCDGVGSVANDDEVDETDRYDENLSERDASSIVHERHEGSDPDTDSFRALLSFANNQLTLEDARQRYQTLRHELRAPFQVKIDLMRSDADEAVTKQSPLLCISGASCSCGRPILCGFPCVHIWMALPHVLPTRRQEKLFATEDRIFAVDIVSYEEAQHLLRVFCAQRWFHKGISDSNAGVRCHSLPAVPSTASERPDNTGFPLPRSRTDELKQNIEDMLATTLTLLSTKNHSHATFVRVQNLISESRDLLAASDVLQATSGSVRQPVSIAMQNPVSLLTRNKKRSPQRVSVIARASSRASKRRKK